MIHDIHHKWADLLLNYCVNVQANENVVLFIETPAVDMARVLYRKVLEAGARPVLRLVYPEILQDVLECAKEDFFTEEPSFELNEIKQIHSWIRIRAPHNSKALQNIDKARVSAYQKRSRPVQVIRLKTKWVGSLFPSHALAQDAGMSLDEYEKFVYNAMFLFDDDPVAKWREIHSMQDELIQRLQTARSVRIIGKDTDLSLNVEGRTWLNSSGLRNMPSGEVFTGPIENSANGIITYQIPSMVNGIEVENVRLRFKDGKVVEAKAEKGDDLLQAQLSTDEGARFIGELGIGTNYNIQTPTKQILYDEKIGGTIHLALGQSYPETGGKNTSAIHWDMICDLRQEGAIYVDGELFQENGQFT